jgi:hypothetical protein
MKISLRIWAFVALHFFVLNAAAQPTINSLSPNAANPGTTITIGGTGFNTTASRNKVFFGATKAVVTAATATSLTVTSPLGGTYYPVSVLDSSTGLTGYSRYAFLPKYNNSAYIPGSINFTAPVGFSSGSSPYLVAIGDIDGDGKPDMAVANYGSNTVSVFKNIHTTGNITSGSFAAKVDFTTGTNPFGIAIGDLDGDGKPDLVVTNGNAASISVFRNTATTGSINAGSFAAKVDFTSGSAPSDVQIADMDGDGKPDLIVDNFSSNTLSVFRNTGSTGSISTASFAAKVDFATGSHPRGVTVADIDGDGKPDIAVANSSGNTLSIFRNISGSGSFTTSSLATRVDFTTGARPIDIAIGDLDGDGKPELAVADGDSNTISVFRNISSSGSITTGSLSARVKFTTGTDPESIAIADVDGDGKPDLAAGNYASATVSVFRNTASTGTINSGSFAAGADVNIGCNLSDTRLADMDDDGKPDIIIVCTGTDAVTVASNAPFFMRPTIASVSPNTANPGTAVTITGTFFNTTAANNEVFFGATKAVVTTASATSLTVTSPIGATYGPVSVLDGSTGLTGYEQYAYLPTFDNSAYISGMVNFNAKIAFATGAAPYWVAIGDLDLDGKADLVVTNNSFATVSVFRNISTNGSITTGSFAAKVDFTTGTGPVSAAISDIDGDGKPEILVVNSGSTSVSVFRNTSTAGSLTTGSFSAKVDFTTGILPYSVAVGDLDGDGKPDMAVANRTSNTVSVFYNKAATGSISASSFATKVDFTTGTVAWNVAIGDLDGDGKPDMAVANNTSNTVSVFRNTCTQGSINSSSFAAKVDFTTVAGPYAIAIGDLDGDGKAEMAVAYNRTNARLSVFRNTASSGSITSGSFAARVDFTLVSSPRSVVIADMDGDGKPDLITANTDSGTVTAFRNTSTSGSITTSSFAAGAAFRVSGVPQTVAVGDLDGDGKPDLAVTNNSTNSVSVLRNNPLSVIYGARSLCFGNSLAFRDSATLGSWTSSAAGLHCP